VAYALPLRFYRDRLMDLSRRNRSLNLEDLSPNRELDLFGLANACGLKSEELISLFLKGKPFSLYKGSFSEDVFLQRIHQSLLKIYRIKETIKEEKGIFPLALAYPIVEGTLEDGRKFRAPLILFPFEMEKRRDVGNTWVIHPSPDGPGFNHALLLLLSRISGNNYLTISEETGFEIGIRQDEFIQHLYTLTKEQSLPFKFSTELFTNGIQPYTAIFENTGIETGTMLVRNSGVIGMFPQSDLSILRDYENWILKSGEDQFPESFSGKQRVAEARSVVYPILPLDHIHREILFQVSAGKSLNVQGPPGTGKSQLIANITGDALARGKKVLIVSQKRVALEVALNRLKLAGLEGLCAMVEDANHDRNELFEKIAGKIALLPEEIRRERTKNSLGYTKLWEDLPLQLEQMESSLKATGYALAKILPCGLSANQMYQEIPPGYTARYPKAGSYFRTYAELDSVLGAFPVFERFKELISPESPWFFRKSFASGIPETLLNGGLMNTVSGIQADYLFWKERGIHLADNEGRKKAEEVIQEILQLCAPYNNEHIISELLASESKYAELNRFCSELKQWITKLKSFPAITESHFKRFGNVKTQLIIYQKNEGKISRFFSSEYKNAIRELKEFNLVSGKKLILSNEGLEHFYQWEKWKALAKQILGFTESNDPEVLSNWVIRFTDVMLRMKQSGFYLQRAFDSTHDHQLSVAIRKFDLGLESLKENLHVNQYNELVKQIEFAPEKIGKWLHELKQNSSEFISADRFFEQFSPELRETIRQFIFRFHADLFTKEGFAHLKFSCFKHWLEEAEANDKDLRENASPALRIYGTNFRDKVRESYKINAERIKIVHLDKAEKLWNGQNGQPGSALKSLYHQVNKKRQKWTVRRLVEQFWHNGLSDLLPCWLASPETVSSVFPFEKGIFDLVLFDEGSHCFAEYALPSLFRGKTVIVAGDQMQLPPYDLYKMRFEEDTIQEEPEEANSILELSALYLPSEMLTVHYRSTSDALIAFSNRYFYKNRLQPFPAVNKDESAVQFVQANGVWKGGVNRDEAEMVLSVLRKLVKEFPEASIGIVTFNYPQQQYLLDLIESWPEGLVPLMQKEHEPLFIKNIENVQGDERDIILISTGYAKDESGAFRYSFGLLNREGGERRLNVAITRARKKMVLVSSIQPEDLPGFPPTGGPDLLARFITYVKQNEQASADLNSQKASFTLPLSHSEILEAFPVGLTGFGSITLGADYCITSNKPSLLLDSGYFTPFESIWEMWVSRPERYESSGYKSLIFNSAQAHYLSSWIKQDINQLIVT